MIILSFSNYFVIGKFYIYHFMFVNVSVNGLKVLNYSVMFFSGL